MLHPPQPRIGRLCAQRRPGGRGLANVSLPVAAMMPLLQRVAVDAPAELAIVGGLALGEAVKVLLRFGWRLLTAPKRKARGPLGAV